MSSKIKDFISNPNYHPYLYFLFIMLMVSYYFIQWPVVGFDADMWNYLNWGRYFFDNNKIEYSIKLEKEKEIPFQMQI